MITLTLRSRDDSGPILNLIRELATVAETAAPHTGLVAAFNPELWGNWTKRAIPVTRDVLDAASPKLCDSGGDVFLYIKSHDPDAVARLAERFLPRLRDLSTEAFDSVAAGKRPDGKVIGGRYHDGITNPTDPVSVSEDVLVSRLDHLGGQPGSAFALTQKFIFDWPAIAAMAPDTEDAMIGRNPEGAALPQAPAHAHIRRAHGVYDSNGDSRKMMRHALPFGTAAGHASREEGLFFFGFCNEQRRLEKILHRLVGEAPGLPVDRLMSVVKGVAGGYRYIPAAAELDVATGAVAVEFHHWDVRSRNGFMFYNSPDYLHQMADGHYMPGDPPSPRLLSLLSRAFSHWRDGWTHRQPFPRLPHLTETLSEADMHFATASVMIRKGMANKVTLSELLSHDTSSYAKEGGLLRFHPKELLVGILPDFTLGRGKEVVPYLTPDEKLTHWSQQLNEFSAMGHVVPDYDALVKLGLDGLLANLHAKLRGVSADANSEKEFYESAILSLEGVQAYLGNWAGRCETAAGRGDVPEDDAENMRKVAARLRRLQHLPPADFHDGAQLVLSFHCCLHLVGELTSLGRLDQILWPLLERSPIPDADAQDIVDCLWVKIGENAFVNRANIKDYVTYGTTAVCGVGGNFPQGGGINQWVQQITVGGYVANDEDTPTGGVNPVTMLCLKAARRIPVNAPTLSLRVYKGMAQDVLDAAATSLLAGGAHPILYQDDKLCEALRLSGDGDDHVPLRWARNYAADGCYEPMFAGATDFAFANVAPLSALEQTLNQGATFGSVTGASSAGPVFLRGWKATYRSPPVETLASFSALQAEFLGQLEWLVVQTYNTIIGNYGNLAGVCPSPLLSVLIQASGGGRVVGSARPGGSQPAAAALLPSPCRLSGLRRVGPRPDEQGRALPRHRTTLRRCL